jgi:hypothetical protein
MLKTVSAKTISGEPVRLWFEDLGRLFLENYASVYRMRYSIDGKTFVYSDIPAGCSPPRNYSNRHHEECKEQEKKDRETLLLIGVDFDSIDLGSIEKVG